jgi:hypothetical protein
LRDEYVDHHLHVFDGLNSKIQASVDHAQSENEGVAVSLIVQVHHGNHVVPPTLADYTTLAAVSTVTLVTCIGFSHAFRPRSP